VGPACHSNRQVESVRHSPISTRLSPNAPGAPDLCRTARGNLSRLHRLSRKLRFEKKTHPHQSNGKCGRKVNARRANNHNRNQDGSGSHSPIIVLGSWRNEQIERVSGRGNWPKAPRMRDSRIYETEPRSKNSYVLLQHANRTALAGRVNILSQETDSKETTCR